MTVVPFQLEINKKRDAELAKLRKLLEDVHLEAEETSHMLRKKHQEAITDLQDQLEILAKGKAKYVFLLPFSSAFSVNQRKKSRCQRHLV
jgi:hypothetical protein